MADAVLTSRPSGGAIATIDSIGDIDTSTVAPTDGQALIWDNGNSAWEPGDAGGGDVLSLPAGAAPAATAGVAKIYAKTVVTGGDALYNFTSGDPTADDIRTGNAGSIVGAPDTGSQYVTNHNSIGVEWGDQLRISNVNNAGTPSVPGNLFNIPNHGIGAGSYTVEFFHNPVNPVTGVGIFCMGYSVWDELLDVAYYSGNNIRVRDVGYDVNGNLSQRYHYFYHNWSSDGGTWKHFAISREVDQPTAGQYRYTVFLDGVELSSSSNTGTGIVNYNKSTNDYLTLGGCRYSQSVFNRPVEAIYDSVNISRFCKYPQGTATFTVPTVPFHSGVAELFCMRSNGNETQLTP